MTKVVIDIGLYHHKIVCEGHATGSNNAVCASISTIVAALASYLESKSVEEGECKSVSYEDGKAYFSYQSSEKPDYEVHGAFVVAALGLMHLAYLEPDYITVMNISDTDIFDAR